MEPLDLIGKSINQRYHIIKPLGEGGTSFVYQAFDSPNNRNVAIKFMKDKLTSAYMDDIIRFKREVGMISDLDHPGIVRVFDSGEFQLKPYIVMELLHGNDLADWLESGKTFTTNSVVSMIFQLAEVLNYVHHYGIIHRDVKPGNIYITGDDSRAPTVKLLDFGISHLIELGELKSPNLVSGTFGYMSPEATGILNRKVDERSDLYSLGVVFYQLLTGKAPFKGIEVKSILHQQAALVPACPGKIATGIPEILDQMIMKLLRKDPDQRYQSATGLLSDLKRYLAGETDFIVGLDDQPQKLTFTPTKLFGRSVESKRLKRLFGQARAGKTAFCLITGEAGIGKSRLMEEVREEIYEKNGLLIRGRCLNHENKAPYQPFRDASDDYLHWLEKTALEIREEEKTRLRNVLGDLGRIAIQFNPRLENLVGQFTPLVPLEPERENQRFLMVLAAFFCQLAKKERPIALFLDDLQWADEGTLNLLEEIIEYGARPRSNSNLLIVGAYRNDEPGNKNRLEQLEKKGQEKNFDFEKIQLLPLDHTQINHLIIHIFNAKTEIPLALTDFILQKSRGNPFFAIHIIRELVENQALSWREARLEIDEAALRHTIVSNNIVDLILRRIESLTAEQIAILCKGAVIGREFEIKLIFKLSNLSEAEIVNIVDEVIARQMLEKSLERGQLLFAHDRIRDAFYHRLSDLEKQSIHLEIAKAIEEVNQSHPEKVLFELAYHYIEGGGWKKALEYALPAADQAKASFVNEEAIKYYQKTIELLEGGGLKGPPWIHAKKALVELYLLTGKYPEVITIAEGLMQIGLETNEKAELYEKVTQAYFKIGDWTKGAETIRKGFALLHEKMPESSLGLSFSLIRELVVRVWLHLLPDLLKPRSFDKEQANRAKGIVNLGFYIGISWLYGLCDSRKLLYSVLRMLNLAETRIGKSKELASCLSAYAAVWTTIPCFKIGIKITERVKKMDVENNDVLGIACGFDSFGFFYAWMGDHTTSIRFFEEGQIRLQQIGHLWEMGQGLIGLGVNYLHISDYRKGILSVNKYLENCQTLKDIYGIMCVKIILANINIEIGNYDYAEEIIKEIARMSVGDEVRFTYCLAMMSYGYLELEKGNYRQAVDYLYAAREVNQKTAILNDFVNNIHPLLADAYLKKSLGRTTRDLKPVRRLIGSAWRKTRAWPNHYGITLRITANYYARLGRNRRAEKYYLQSIRHNETYHRRYEAAKCYLEYGCFLNSQKRMNEAFESLGQAQRIFNEIGANVYLKKCEDPGIFLPAKNSSMELTSRDRLTAERRKNAIITTSRYISSILDINILLEKVMDSAIELTGAERGILLLYPEAGPRKLHLEVIRNFGPAGGDGGDLTISYSIISKVETDKLPLIIGDALVDEALKNNFSIITSRIKSVICTPIMTKGEMLGIIYLDNSLISGLFSEEDLDVLGLFASQAGVSIENARLWQSLEERVKERTEQLEAANQSLNQKNSELLTMNEQLKEHAAVIAELAITKERNRVATSVHDTTGQTMTLLLRLLEVSIVTCLDDPLTTRETLQNAFQITQNGLKELRRSLSGLVLEETGTTHLMDALGALFASFQSSGMKIEFTADGTWDNRSAVCFNVIYRTCQEALTNALRHGRAKYVWIIIKFGPEGLKLFIVDNGQGCPEIKKGMGLTGMEQRIQDLGGSCVFSSDGESGFNIQVEIPF